LVLKAIIVAVIADALLLAFICFVAPTGSAISLGATRVFLNCGKNGTRLPRDRFLSILRKQIFSTAESSKQWRSTHSKPPSARARACSNSCASGLIEKRIFEAGTLPAGVVCALWSRWPHASAEEYPAGRSAADSDLEIRLAALRGLGTHSKPQAAEKS